MKSSRLKLHRRVVLQGVVYLEGVTKTGELAMEIVSSSPRLQGK